MPAVYLSLGSNFQRENNLRDAVKLLTNEFGELTISPVYRSAPDNGEGEYYFNCCVGFNTDKPLATCRELFRQIENNLDRDRTIKTRVTIDIDILLYGDAVSTQDQSQLPHSDIIDKPYVLIPLADLAPDLIHPKVKKSIKQLVSEQRMAQRKGIEIKMAAVMQMQEFNWG